MKSPAVFSSVPLSLLLCCSFACDAPTQSGSSSQSATIESIRELGSIARDEWKYFGPFDVHPEAGLRAEVVMRGGGDVDLYVREGAAPTETLWDCRPYEGGAVGEECHHRGGGLLYVALNGYAWNTEYKLTIEYLDAATDADCGNNIVDEGEVCDDSFAACSDLEPGRWASGSAMCSSDCQGYDTSTCMPEPACGNATLDTGELCDGKPIACTVLDPNWIGGEAVCLDDCSGWSDASCVPSDSSGLKEYASTGTVVARQWRHYGPFAASGDFTAELGGLGAGSGDSDLYVRRGSAPDRDHHDCRSTAAGSIEGCQLTEPGLYFVSVLGYAPESNYNIQVRYALDTQAELIVETGSGTLTAGQWAYYGPYNLGDAQLHTLLSGVGDADLYVKRGAQPTESDFDCRPYLETIDERCVLSGGGGYWVGVKGYAASSEFELRVVF